MERKITLAAVILSICGLVSEYIDVKTSHFLKFALRIFNFESFSFGFGEANILNVIGYLILLISALLYFFSGFREMRLLRFMFSLAFLSKIVSLFILSMYVASSGFGGYMLISLGGTAVQIIIVIVSYKAIVWLGKSSELLTEVNDYGEMQTIVYLPASNWQRVLNLTVDFGVCYLIFFPVLEGLIRLDAMNATLRAIETAFGEKGGLYVVIIFFRSIFYILFEGVFQATPGKFLSETKVTDGEGNRPVFPNIIGRTFSRFVPFEPLSFFANSGWHDNWSGTEVIQEKRTGVKGGYYFLILPAAILGFFCYVFISEAYHKNKRDQYEKAQFEQNVADTDYKLAHISTNDIIELRDDDQYQSKYLKAEKVTADTVEFSVVKKPDSITSYSTTIQEAEMEEIYNAGKDQFKKVTVSRAKLPQAVSRKQEGNFKGVKLLGENAPMYRIESIEQYFMPRLKLNSSYGYSDDYISLSITNKGWPADIVAVKDIGGDIKWPSTNAGLPIRLSGGKYSYQTREINGRGKDIEDFKVQLTVKDTIGRTQIYEVAGKKSETPVMKRIK
jgi:hypothetical protein